MCVPSAVRMVIGVFAMPTSLKELLTMGYSKAATSPACCHQAVAGGTTTNSVSSSLIFVCVNCGCSGNS